MDNHISFLGTAYESYSSTNMSLLAGPVTVHYQNNAF